MDEEIIYKENSLLKNLVLVGALAVFSLSVFVFYSSNVFSGEGGTGDYENCTDAADNDSDGYVDFGDLDCLRATGKPDLLSTSDSGISNTDDYTNNTSVDIYLSCDSSLEVRLYVDNTITGYGSACSAGQLIYEGINLGEGTHQINGTQYNANLSSESGFSETYVIVIDTTAPSTSGAPDLVAASDTGTSSTDNLTNDTTPTFSESCSDGNIIQLVSDDVATGSTTTCSSSSFTATTGTLSAGDHDIAFTETDISGNISATSTALTISIDATSPVISEVSAIETSTLTTPSYTFTTDEAGTITYGGSCSSSSTSATYGSNTVTFTALAAGTYSDCTITVTDNAGNESNTISVTSFTISSAPSSNQIISGSQAQTIHTPIKKVCEPGDLYNSYNGLPCAKYADIPVGCFANYLFNIFTGESCVSTLKVSDINPNIQKPTNTPGFKFEKDISWFTVFSDDVRQLQIFLNTHGFLVATTGAGSPGKETRYFGPATIRALSAFQKHVGIVPSIGYFGPITRSYINSLL